MNYKKIDYEVVITIIWVVFWLAFLAICFDRSEGIGGIGAFLSGIFAPLALFWFYKSYRIQSSELKLQREELTLQRKALEQSVLAQRGSETALKEQSEALFRQLEIIENIVIESGIMVASEKRLFEVGESSIFLINSRENKLIDSILKMNKINNELNIAIAKLFETLRIEYEND
ncbi:hypothetical protein [uncultured Psychrobacter sp.]|uniref:hypothetical protein n=1 Tax=uncultured Psychrobacter sp. TaxID=259303 RepID=UPI0025999BF8|nr:hypothetical protein [uncultured Psychrobacter sp.]